MSNIDLYMNAMIYRMNLMMFGAPPVKQVSAHEVWDYCTISEAEGETYRHWYREEVGQVGRTHVTLTRTEYEWITDIKAVEQLKALMDQWREDGKAALADAVETREESDGEETTTESIYASLGRSRTITTHEKIPIEQVKFYRILPYTGNEKPIEEPRKNARITGIGS